MDGRQRHVPGSAPVSREIKYKAEDRKRKPGLMNVDFCKSTERILSEFRVKSMNPWIQPASCQQSRLLFVLENLPLHTTGLLPPINHSWSAAAYLSIVADHVHPSVATIYRLLMAPRCSLPQRIVSPSRSRLELDSWRRKWASVSFLSHQIVIWFNRFGMRHIGRLAAVNVQLTNLKEWTWSRISPSFFSRACWEQDL